MVIVSVSKLGHLNPLAVLDGEMQCTEHTNIYKEASEL